ncbi:probable casein kinase I isoform delta at N-terminal half [Coccomyxa sp. Obi]|nr:probable casein kinase I isoform delta at N-terminal half [Coccomyxa sp. Obi]
MNSMAASDEDVSHNPEEAEQDELPTVPDRVSLSGMPIYLVEKRLGKGGFGQVCLGRRLQQRKSTPANKPNKVAIKFESTSSKGCSNGGPPYEWQVYTKISGCYGIPKIFAKGTQAGFHIMVMELLGPSVWDVWNTEGQMLPVPYVACVATEALRALQDLHGRGYVHGDVKPENLLLGAPDTPDATRLYLVDLGLAQRYTSSGTMSHLPYHQYPNEFRGTIRYASVHAHLGRISSRRDDLESLAYTLVFLLSGCLPWQGFQGDDKGYQVCKKKMDTNAEMLCLKGWPSAFRVFMEAVLGLKYDEEPKYDAYMALFRPLTGHGASRPLTIFPVEEPPPKKASGRKRARDDSAENTAAELRLSLPDEARKKARTGWAGSQWITVYVKRKPMKQRYHYNVNADRLTTHVEKGYGEGLLITAVASSKGLWAVIMDASSKHKGQAYKLTNGVFMPRDWITEKWDQGYYITGVAGSENFSSLVVMTKGTKWTQQSYKVDSTFPYEWIKKKWRENFHVTSIGTAGTPSTKQQWAVVMSRDTEFRHQVVEIDFQYPSEGIHYHWDKGYRITACGATQHQAAVVMSLPKRAGGESTQETLRTGEFPAAYVKEKWERDLYIDLVAYGRTVS